MTHSATEYYPQSHWNGAMARTCKQMEDAFCPERRAQNEILLAGYRVQSLVEGRRYSFPEAVRLMKVDATQVKVALDFLADDNDRMNATYGTDIHGVRIDDYVMVKWFREQEEDQATAEVIEFPAGAV